MGFLPGAVTAFGELRRAYHMSKRIQLFLMSALALYMEVVVIRWMAAEIRMFAYLKNLALLAAFLGLGLGILGWRTSKLQKLLPWLITILTLTLVFSPQLLLTRLFFPDVSLYQWGGSLLSPSLL
jgi:hypothetical protein